jgi:hypothetical protein
VYTSYRYLRRNLRAGNSNRAPWAAAIKKIGTSQESWRMVTHLAAGSDLFPNRP